MVSGWHERAKALIVSGDPFDDTAKDEFLALINERLDAEGLRGKVWGNMTYACESCGRAEVREMEVGVEGPPHWRDDLVYIASAFTTGRCDDCGGRMTHTNWKGDVEYDTPREPTALAVFRVPRVWPHYPTRGIRDDGTVIIAKADSAFLSLNLGALTR